MRVILFGSRSNRKAHPVYQRLAKLEMEVPTFKPALDHGAGLRLEHITVVIGDADGTDRIGDVCAQLLGFGVERHPADWTGRGRSAGMQRNAEMCNLGADLAVCYWDKESPGTAGMIGFVEKAGIELEVRDCDGQPIEGYRGLL